MQVLSLEPLHLAMGAPPVDQLGAHSASSTSWEREDRGLGNSLMEERGGKSLAFKKRRTPFPQFNATPPSGHASHRIPPQVLDGSGRPGENAHTHKRQATGE